MSTALGELNTSPYEDIERWISDLVHEIRYYRSRGCECANETNLLSKLQERLDKEVARSASLKREVARITADYNRTVQFLRDLVLLETPSDVESLSLQIQELRCENESLRNLLGLANYAYKDEIVSDADSRSLLSEPSSFHLMTPPRSPIHPSHGTRNAAKRIPGNRVGISSPTQILQPPQTIPQMELDGLFADIADVGPPMSPPPDACGNVPQLKVNKESNDSADAQEAEMGSQEVDHDLSSSI